MIEGKKKRKHQTMQAVPISFSGKKTTEKLGKRHGNGIFIRKLIAFLCKILRFIGSVELYMFIEELGNCCGGVRRGIIDKNDLISPFHRQKTLFDLLLLIIG